MNIESFQYKGKKYYSVYVDKTSSSGILRFSHEISVTFEEDENILKFISAWHIGVSDMEWDATEESDFEQTFPGLLQDMREEIKTNNAA